LHCYKIQTKAAATLRPSSFWGLKNHRADTKEAIAMQATTTEMFEAMNAVMPITSRPALAFLRGRGSWLWDHEDRVYLDFVQGWAVNALGHCPALIARALNDQANTLINCSPAYHNLQAVLYARELAKASGMDHVFLANSGAEANEGIGTIGG
jgi:acetylornithine/succinyldiaminopimelate/putrescine aminotransferase